MKLPLPARRVSVEALSRHLVVSVYCIVSGLRSMPTGYTLVYNPTELDLEMTAVPEPSTHHGEQALAGRRPRRGIPAGDAAPPLRPQSGARLVSSPPQDRFSHLPRLDVAIRDSRIAHPPL